MNLITFSKFCKPTKNQINDLQSASHITEIVSNALGNAFIDSQVILNFSSDTNKFGIKRSFLQREGERESK